jgi:hypothetical protein
MLSTVLLGKAQLAVVVEFMFWGTWLQKSLRGNISQSRILEELESTLFCG